jgi:tRNA (guanine-N7-)-methyltransferase
LQKYLKNRGKQNKLKGSRKTKHLLFQPTREEVVGDLFPLKMEFRFLKNDNRSFGLGCGKENIQLVLPKDIPIKISLE